MSFLGPSGGTGGGNFFDPEDNQRLARVTIASGDVIDAIQVTREASNGTLVDFDPHGGSGGAAQAFNLADREHIIRIDGRYGSFVNSITISTDFGQMQTFGGTGGSADFTYQAPEGFEISGFAGRAGAFIDAIGVSLRRI
jgi:hypothetical protein